MITEQEREARIEGARTDDVRDRRRGKKSGALESEAPGDEQRSREVDTSRRFFCSLARVLPELSIHRPGSEAEKDQRDDDEKRSVAHSSKRHGAPSAMEPACGRVTVSSQRVSRDPSDVRVLGLDLDFVGVTLDGAVGTDVASLQLSGEREKFVGVDVGVIVVTHVRVRKVRRDAQQFCQDVGDSVRRRSELGENLVLLLER